MAEALYLWRFSLLLFVASHLVETQRFHLSDNWSLRREDDVNTVYSNVSLPIYVHQVLLSNNVTDDPYFGFNDLNYRWIPESNWTFSLVFNYSFSHDKKYFLVFEGLDTIAEVKFNGKYLGETYNMFCSWNFPVSSDSDENSLEVKIVSPVKSALEKAETYPYVVPQVCPVPEFRGFCQFNFIRKEASSFSWDWGPGFAPQGIWKPVYLHSVEKHDMPVSFLSFNLFKNESLWIINVTALPIDTSFPDALSSCDNLQIKLNISDLGYSNSSFVHWGSYPSVFWSSFAIPDIWPVNLWWPSGFGAPYLYRVSAVVSCSRFSPYSAQRMLGFREVELVQDEVRADNGSSAGNTFFFRVNKVPIFVKGSNWIPADAFQTRVTDGRLEYLLRSSKTANMNMLRVWGGGVFEREHFYELADQLGIMIWQDMMFACSLYPVGPDFLDNVEEEVRVQIYKLRSHPSIVVWAGNNENEAALAQNWWSVPDEMLPQYREDYVDLYVNTIQTVIESIDASRPYLTSSPSNGVETIREGYISANPYSEFFGDTHYYDYVTDCFDLSNYQIPRFASEYGFQSWPSYSSIVPVTSQQERKLNSDWFTERNHHPDGNEQMLFNIHRHFGYEMPTRSNSSSDFEWFIYLTQLENALCIKTETEHYLQYYNVLDSSGRGNTMGAMYWQLNDIWQAPSWASIDYYGKWKMLHNFALRFFEPVHLFGYYSSIEEDVTVFVSSSHNESLRFRIEVIIYSLQQANATVNKVITDVNVTSNSASKIAQFPLFEFVNNTDCDLNEPSRMFCFAQLNLLANDDSVVSTNEVYFDHFNDTSLFPCSEVDVIGLNFNQSNNEVTIKLAASSVALFFWMDHSPEFLGYWENNGNHLVPIEGRATRTFRFYRSLNSSSEIIPFLQSLKLFYLNMYPNCLQ